MNDQIISYNEQLKASSPEGILKFFLEKYKGKVAFATSLGAEDQVITAMLAGMKAEIKIFTLDTGRLFQETYDLLDITVKKYRMPIEICFPEAKRIKKMVSEKGINLFYESVENRKLCCHIRKVEPLQRALSGMQVWISGLRREQSMTRIAMETVEWDESNNMIKINPLIEWTRQQVWDYIRDRKIPYNPLHDKGFPSIGCLPCTRATLPGENERAGRWWWEDSANKECGLHVSEKKDN
jgi:phosphoadenosine phosphosulfate reductase